MDNANLLWRKGSFEILSKDVGALSPRKMNLLIKRCGTVSHQGWKTSRKTPAEFIKMLRKRGHLSVLEHSWFTFLLNFNLSTEKKVIELELLKGNHLFCITERPTSLIISGNARMFLESYLRNPNTITATLLNFLHQRNPVLFPQTVNKDLVLPPSSTITFNPFLENRQEKLVHKAMTVIFQGISRGFSHEDVRSRNGNNKIASYTQRSTRYVNPLKKNSFNFILPYRKDLPIGISLNLNLKNLPEVFPRNIALTNKEIIDLFLMVYQGLINSHLRPEEARQWLPIGIETEIAQTMNYLEWRHWFKIRTQKLAHPEIRFVACNLLQRVQKDIPGVFEGFKFYKDEENICYTKFTPPDNENKLLI